MRFVLSDAYTNLRREEREALLHEGTGPTTMSAFVEIIFDNQDNRFPTGKEEVIIRRTISVKNDEYSLDRKNCSKSDVMNLLESAGFSRSNPYYIVPQGRVTALTQAKDSDRLDLLKEIAGTNVYDNRRRESVKIIQETQMKRDKITELMGFIEERLRELEEEKQELVAYQELDREKRGLESHIYHKELEDIKNKLQQEQITNADAEWIQAQAEKSIQAQKQIQKLEADIAELQNSLEIMDLEQGQFSEDYQALLKEKTRLNLWISDSQALGSITGKDQLIIELDRISQELSQKEAELASTLPSYEDLLAQEAIINEQLQAKETEHLLLVSRLGRAGQFRSKPARDKWLKAEIAQITSTLDPRQAKLKKLEQEATGLKDRIRIIKQERSSLEMDLSSLQQDESELKAKLSKLITERNQATEERKTLWRNEAKREFTSNHLKEDIRKNERLLYSTLDRNLILGLQAVDKIIASKQINGIYGPLYRLFKAKREDAKLAIDVTAGNSMFHVVVDSDETASRLLEQMGKELGRITLMPLNQLSPRLLDFGEVGSDAIPIVKLLDYNQKFEKAIQQAFGRTLLCESLEVAAVYSRRFKINAITANGDKVDHKGALTGGFHDERISRLDAAIQVTRLYEQLSREVQESAMSKSRIVTLDTNITQLLSDVQVLETRIKNESESQLDMAKQLKALQGEYQNALEALNKLENLKRKTILEIQKQQQELNSMEVELKSEFNVSVEATNMTQLAEQLEALRAQQASCSETRGKATMQKMELESRISNLKFLQAEYSQKLNEGDFTFNAQVLAENEEKLKRVETSLISLEQEITEKHQQVSLAKQEKRQAEEALEEAKGLNVTIIRELEGKQQEVEKSLNTRLVLMQQKESCLANLRSLGLLAEESAIDQSYKRWNEKQVMKRLHQVKESLKAYAHVNKKALEQFNNFYQQRETLKQRREELEQSSNSIQELIDILDQRKEEAIQRTFNQVGRYFSEVFQKLVPNGQGKLVMLRPADPAEGYTGVAIKVSFHPNEEGVHIAQLSGGQRSVVALALIFAIQQCDPAPFYLFDEIDANLDTAHRAAVAELIHTLATNDERPTQFITTTFRPELLKHADRCYGVTFQHKVSRLSHISHREALQFVDNEVVNH